MKTVLQITGCVALAIACCIAALGQGRRQLIQPTGDGQKRIALVIGNGGYKFVGPLDNPVNDATDIAAALQALGFDVIRGTDTNLIQMRRLIREFGEKLAQQKGIGLFYYAGHGVEVRGRNFLVPVDAEIAREVETEDNAIDVNTVLRQMDAANNGFNIVILDACRNNPFSRGWSRSGDSGGLAQTNAPTGTYIAFAAAPGSTASDGKGTRNGVFTGALLKILKRPNLKLEEVFKATREEVMALTDNKQVPWDSSSIKGDFYFSVSTVAQSIPQVTQSPVPKATPLPTPTPVAVSQGPDVEGMYWQTVSNGNTQSLYESYLAEYPKGKYVPEANTRIESFKQAELLRLKDIERSKWHDAQNHNTSESYNSYLTIYPNGEFTADARSGIKALETKAEQAKWLDAQNLNTKDSYNSYLAAYPNGKYVSDARSGIKVIETSKDQAKWDEVQLLNRKSAFQSYLSAYLNGKFAASARQKIIDFEAEDARRLAEDAKAKEKAKWDQAEAAKSVEGYKDYLAAYPLGVFASIARLRLRDLGVNLSPAYAAGTLRKTPSGIELAYIPPGEFLMGSENGERDEKPVHKVTISNGFWMGKYEVTQSQWQNLMGSNPSQFKNCGGDCLVEQVSWDDAQLFIAKLNAANDGFQYSLPTEAEWEYAARAGTTGDYYGEPDDVGWFFGNSSNTTHTVGQKQPNKFGLYDMSGNVWEWCKDFYVDSYNGVRSDGGANNTVGELKYRVLRGGSWAYDPKFVRSAIRYGITPVSRRDLLGFRVAARAR